MKLKYILAIIAVGLSVSLNAQTTQKLTATKASEYGIIYSLPSTVVDITIETETMVKKPGEFYRYAKKYLNSDDAISDEIKTTRLKSVVLNVRGVANDSERYLMQFKPGTSPFMMLNNENMPLSINAEEVEQSKVSSTELPKPIPPTPTPLETDAAQQVISGEMAKSQSLSKRAEIAATQLFDIRQIRTDLLSGDAEQMPPDGRSMELLLDNMQAQESALLAMFMGTTQTYSDVKTFTYTPQDEVQNEVLARISAVDGIVDAGNLAGVPVYLSVKVEEKGELPVDEKGVPKTFPKGGVAYNIPGKISIKIDCEGKNYCNQVISSAQHGVVFGIDPKLFVDKKDPIYVLFDPVTGAIKELGSVKNLSK